MEETLKKSIRNGFYSWIVFALVSFSFGIYDFTSGLVVFNLLNLFLMVFGAIIITTIFFILGFCISLIFYYFNEKRKIL